jgi:peptidoglycan hydrolase CwlO-like protein
MKDTLPRKERKIDQFALKSTSYIGSPSSLVLHTIFFIGIFSLSFFGIAFDQILLILTTLVSLEAIYLAIFIQISVNQQALQLQAVSHEVEEISEDVDEISRDIDEIQEEVGDLAEEVEEIGEDIEEDDREDELAHRADVERIEKIEGLLADLIKEIRKKK